MTLSGQFESRGHCTIWTLGRRHGSHVT